MILLEDDWPLLLVLVTGLIVVGVVMLVKLL